MKLQNKHLTPDPGKVLTNGKLYAEKVFVTGDPKIWKEVSDKDPKYLAFLKMKEDMKKKQEEKHDISR